MGAPRLLLAEDPGKRQGERWLLAYSPLWIAVMAAVTLSRVFTRWGDLGHLILGAALCLPLWLMPLLAERRRPLSQRYLSKAVAYITVMSLLQNYYGARLFFDGLGMQYHFNVRLVLNRTPLFLYLVTVAYFSTYYVVQQVALRQLLARRPRASRLARLALLALLSYATAFAETFFMANEWLRDAFSYADKGQALWVGSLCYGTLFLISLPPFYRIDEGGGVFGGAPGAGAGAGGRASGPTLGRVLWDGLAANMLILVAYEAYLAGVLGR